MNSTALALQKMVLLALATILIAGCNQKEKDRELQKQLSDVDKSWKTLADQTRLDADRIEYENIQLEFGDAAAVKWDKCLADPPKAKSNQESCSKLLAHIAKVQAADKKAEEVKESKW
jgi:hypothetical protein